MSTATRNRQIFAAVIGNALEWYDFVIYGFMTVIISRLFFPAESEYASLLIAMATFGVGFFMRPVGGVLIGLYADRRGRKAALQLIILLMTVATAMIAFAPNLYIYKRVKKYKHSRDALLYVLFIIIIIIISNYYLFIYYYLLLFIIYYLFIIYLYFTPLDI
jgi:MFS family permease